MTSRAFIVGCSGLSLSAEERDFISTARPWGLILFGRNVETPDQVKALVESFRDAVEVHAPVLIDQEGGRVARLGAPFWPRFPAARRFGDLYLSAPAAALEAVYLEGRLIGHYLALLGIDIDCMPVLDLHLQDKSDVIGDRSFGSSPQIVSSLGRAVCNGLLESGVLPVIKHIPGHGRATVDSHECLPVVDGAEDVLRETDFEPFRQLSDMPIAMSAHVMYPAFDSVNCATLSKRIIDEVIRDYIGFDGVLMMDDISMQALTGSVVERGEAAWAAGCDIVLHCNGRLDEMRAVAEVAPLLSGRSATRCDAALRRRAAAAEPLDVEASWARLEDLMGRF